MYHSFLIWGPWTARRANQFILKEISAGCWLEGLMLKLKLQYFVNSCKELTYLKRSWYWERLRAGREGGDRERDGWMASLTQRTWVWVDSRSWCRTGRTGVMHFMGSQRVGHAWETKVSEKMTSMISDEESSFSNCFLNVFFFLFIFQHFKVCLWGFGFGGVGFVFLVYFFIFNL